MLPNLEFKLEPVFNSCNNRKASASFIFFEQPYSSIIRGRCLRRRGFLLTSSRASEKNNYKTSINAARIENQGKKEVIQRPSSKKLSDADTSMSWRLFGIEIDSEVDPGKDDLTVHSKLHEVVCFRLACKLNFLPAHVIRIVRKSFDARKSREHKFVYTVEIDEVDLFKAMELSRANPHKLNGSPQSIQRVPSSGTENLNAAGGNPQRSLVNNKQEAPHVLVVGSGPAGLFSALVLAEAGCRVTLIERGLPVEARGRSIGALITRRLLDEDSNFCYGEGGAGTWSDGKLTTRIGKNSEDVRKVLTTLVHFGAPERILVDGKPHLGTDRLVKILRSFRKHLTDLGVDIRFGTKLEALEIHNGRVQGAHVRAVSPELADSLPPAGILPADYVVLAVGHSPRQLYRTLANQGVHMSAKDFAVGFRVEHPQSLINEIQYGKFSALVDRGKGRLPVADYSLTAQVPGQGLGPGADPAQGSSRGCFSFCMCPGGQVVPTSTTEAELCVNGMSFSNRSSLFANAALVTSVGTGDFGDLLGAHGQLAGMEFQSMVEREAAVRGGGGLVAPVQTVVDFLEGRISEGSLPKSSYRMGVRSAPLDDIYPTHVTNAIKTALLKFDRQLPGFISPLGLLHGVETRTSAPVRMDRDRETYESVSVEGLFPAGEGAGYAGGIVSAAVDGIKVGLAIAKKALSSAA